MTDPDQICGCDPTEKTPLDPTPPPFEASLSFRVGRHASFLDTMKAGVSSHPDLRLLTTRDPSDPAIALLDGWATTLEVLTFYQERIANEGFIGTAVERRSLLELARLIGYQLAPGVSAETYLAFSTDEIPGSPTEVTVPASAIVQSIPVETDELPQTFETEEALLARSVFNDMRLELSLYTEPLPGDTVIYLDVAEARLSAGDALVLLGDERIASTASRRWQVRRVLSAETIPEDPISRLPARTVVTLEYPLDGAERLPQTGLEIFAFRRRASLFGHNAQPWETLPISLRLGEVAPLITTTTFQAQQVAFRSATPPPEEAEFAIASDEDLVIAEAGPLLDIGNLGGSQFVGTFDFEAAGVLDEFDFFPGSNSSLIKGPFADRKDSWADAELRASDPYIYLDQIYDEFVAGGWLVLRRAIDGGTEEELFSIEEAAEVSHSDFNQTAKVTRLRIAGTGMEQFSPRSATVYGASEAVAWARKPIETPVSGLAVQLENPVDGLAEGQVISIRGEAADGSGSVGLIREIDSIATLPAQGSAEMQETIAETAEIELTSEITPPLLRDTVRINANVVAASHGQSRAEQIGSGNAALAFQKISLPGTPLAYLSAPNETGRASTLEVRVNQILWDEAPELLSTSASDRVYTSEIDNDGVVTLSFGDGLTGARLPSGDANVEANYRIGGGLAGLFGPDRLTQPLTRPVGLRSVTNPVSTSGAEDPETLETARQNAPTTVKTLGRIVSLNDYEDFARSFGGIAKAKVTPLWDGTRTIAHLTISGAGGQILGPTDKVYQSLVTAIDAARPRSQPIRIDSAAVVNLIVDAEIWVKPAYLPEVVLADVRAVLEAEFSFDARGFADSLAASAILALIQDVPGVDGAHLEAFNRLPLSSTDTEPASLLLAAPARYESGAFQQAEILTLDPSDLILREAV